MKLPAALGLVASVALLRAAGSPTETHFLSGHGPKDAVPWEFSVTGGRRAGEPATIPVPSNWELQGFGTYHYGQEQSKSDEHGLYRRRFGVPPEWKGRRIRLVFDGVMTDAAVKINGRSAGPVHQGGFYRFRYDITSLVKFADDNVLEVDVAKVSADPDTERAERGGDYWVFGGIFRPVWLEALPAQAIEQVAIDARADGALTADVTLGAMRDPSRPDGPALVPEQLEARVFDAAGQPVGPAVTEKIPAGGTGRVRLSARIDAPRLWTAETPNLYTLRVSRWRGREELHAVAQRFGFRTFEVRDGEGLFLNGQRILLKGVDRHSFRPETGRALNREDCYADARLIREMNMNAVRMSHYPPDEAFLEACDELGLYVLDELSGWQHAHGTPVGRLLVREMVERDVNHPGILFWDNGNEGGFNRDLDGEVALYDPQHRRVLHPWDPFDGVDTKHYTAYDDLVRRLHGPNLVMPTEVLHALYDGGAGAGLEDYWRAISGSPVGAGAFIWDFADEGVVRTDQGGRVDVFSTFAPDGIVGPHFEKEGSYYAVRDIWSPVQIDRPVLDGKFDGTLTIHNRYDFTSLAQCRFSWQLLRHPDAAAGGAAVQLVASGALASPAIAPHEEGKLSLALPPDIREADVLAVIATGPDGQEVWTWTWPTAALASRVASAAAPGVERGGLGANPTVTTIDNAIHLNAGEFAAVFDSTTGLLREVRRGEKVFALANARRGVAFTALKLEISPDGANWKTIFDSSRRNGDGSRYDFPPQTVAAVRISNVRDEHGAAMKVKAVRVGHTPERFPAESAGAATVTSGTGRDAPTGQTVAWFEATGGASGLERVRWTLRGDGSLQLDYAYTLNGEFAYHGITFDHAEEKMKSLRWFGEGPARVWQNRLPGTSLGVHEIARHDLQPGESWGYPEFQGCFAGLRWARLDTAAGPLTVVSNSPEIYLRVGTPRISHPNTTVDFPPGDFSFLHAIPAMGSKFKPADQAGPSGQWAKAAGRYAGALTFRLGD